jgi:signal transduction histidine kinase/ligand-binding sensor domain-containing protein
VKKVLVVLLFYYLGFFPVLTGQGSQKKLIQYSVEDGLSQSSIYSIIQDVYGYIWISTGNGLNSFDGRNFNSYFPPVLAGSSYNVNRIRKVLADDIGNLWVGTDEGLYYLNRITNEMVDPFTEIKQLKEGFCYPIFITKDTIHALIADSSVLSIHIRDHHYRETHLGTNFPYVISLVDEAAHLAAVSSSSIFWLFGSDGGELKIRNFKTDRQISAYLSQIKYFKDNKYFILLHDELLIYNLNTRRIESPVAFNIPLNKGKSVYKSIKQLRSGDIWIGTSAQGIFVLDSNLKYKYQIKEGADQSGQPLQLKNLTTMFEDKDGHVWVGTDGYGLILFRHCNSGFNLLNSASSAKGKLSSDFIWSFYEDEDKNLWIGTSNEGLNKWDRATNTIENIYLSNKKTYPTPNDIYAICGHQEDKLLVGTTCGLWQFDKTTQRSAPISNQFEEDIIRRTSVIIPLGNSRYLAQISNRCFQLNHKDQLWLFDTIPMADSVAINFTYQSKSGKLFAFSTNGIYDLSSAEIGYQSFMYQSGPMTMRVNAIAEIEEGIIYTATDKGLAVLNFNGKISKIYSTPEGLPNRYLYGVLADNKNHLWISSNRGLTHFNPATEKFDNYGLNDGLQSFEYNAGATYKNKDGEMFFGGINGFNYFHPDSIFSSEICPVIVISGLKVNDREFLPDSSIMSKKTLYLGHNQNTITFEFNTIDFINPGFINYYCYLEGNDKDWVSLGTIPNIRYSNLSPGKYKLMVKALGRQGNWTRTTAELIVIIARPYWMKPWFIILMAGWIISIIAILVYYLSIRKIRRKLLQLEHQREISLIRRRISSDLHDDIGTGLSKLAMMNDTILLESNQNPEMKERLKKVSSGARSLIDHLRVIVWTLNPQFDQLESLISYIHQQAGDFLDNSPLKTRFDLPAKIPQVTVSPEFKRNVHYTVMEALHNVIKHSGSKEVLVKIEIINNNLIISISDNGRGIDPERKAGFGNGLHFMKKRIEDINGELSIESSANKGTSVKISVGF